jgi:hypothetical protein
MSDLNWQFQAAIPGGPTFHHQPQKLTFNNSLAKGIQVQVVGGRRIPQ